MLSAHRNKLETVDYIIEPVEDFSIFNGFSCSDSDLDEFICKDAHTYAEELLAITYSFRIKQGELVSEPVAFASILNDAIRHLNKSQRRKMFHHKKRNYEQYPAVKIGRFGVSSKYCGLGIGKAFLSALKSFFITRNRTGCRFITVDAYPGVVGFYEKNDFSSLLPLGEENNGHTVSMYLDLKRVLLQLRQPSVSE